MQELVASWIMINIKQVLGDNIRYIREKRGMTLDDLSIVSKMSRTFISDIERSQKAATVTSIGKIAIALKVTPAQLLTPNAYRNVE